MTQLAIRGHATRGKEVIEILEMLGGKNPTDLKGKETDGVYIISSSYNGEIDCLNVISDVYKIFTLEEFLEKYPYKVGDRVIIKRKNQEAIIDKVVWCCDTITYWLKYNDFIEGNWRAEHLQPYKEETMKNKLEQITLDIPNGYEFFGIDDDNKIVLTKKQSQYPKTYEECCRTVNADPFIRLIYDLSEGQKYSYDVDNLQHYENIRKLLICRDAYWKIAVDWKPEFRFGKKKYCIMTKDNKVISATVEETNRILVFPTAEIRDNFYENFKELIELCKELL